MKRQPASIPTLDSRHFRAARSDCSCLRLKRRRLFPAHCLNSHPLHHPIRWNRERSLEILPAQSGTALTKKSFIPVTVTFVAPSRRRTLDLDIGTIGASLSSDARCNTPGRFGIGRIETSGSVAMRGYSHLSDDEREQIGLLKVLGHSIGAIARALRRPKSTISRELSRNRLPSGRYSPLHAAGAYQLRRRREALIEKDRDLRSFVLDRLAEGWTPEQIAGWLKAGNERRVRAVGCETIYAFIYRAAQKAEQLWRYLTRRHKRRRPRRSRPSRDTIKDRVSIHERPENIDARTEAGHWEGDLIICKRTRPVLVLHERKSRVTLLAKLTGKTAAETISVMLAVFARINPALRKSITFDNGPSPSTPCYGPCAIWQRGSATLTPPGKKAALKTPMVDYDAGYRPTAALAVQDRRLTWLPASGPRSASGCQTQGQRLSGRPVHG